MTKRFVLLNGLVASALLVPALAFAQDFDNIEELLKDFRNILNILTGIIIGLALVFFLWGLAVFILNAGDDEKRSAGKKKMIWGAVAFAVMIGIWGIVNFLLEAFGLDLDAPDVPEIPE